MAKLLSLFLYLLLFSMSTIACTMNDGIDFSSSAANNNGNSPNDTVGNRLKIKVGSTSTTFTATLLNNATVTAFKARLPLTVSMTELNGNEKYYNLRNHPDARPLPASASNPQTIQTGDLMLYGSNTLVLFYKTFPTSYSYTRLGRVDNPSGLAAALGTGSVTVTFELE